MTDSKNEVITFDQIDKDDVKHKIYEIRGKKVMLDSDIAMYFGVTTGNLNKAKNRNIERFPSDFSFTLTKEEISVFQIGIPMQTKGVKGGRSNNLKAVPVTDRSKGKDILEAVRESKEKESLLKQLHDFKPEDADRPHRALAPELVL